MNLFRKKSTNYILVVSGLPRSGTSAMMQMLLAGGVPLLYDDHRPADANNPRGYYELEPVKRLHTHEDHWLADAIGKAVKVVSPLLPYLPTGYRYRVLFMERDMDEIIRSQLAMRQQLQSTAPVSDDLRANSVAHLAQTKRWLESQKNLQVNYVHHHQLIEEPRNIAEQVCQFLGMALDVNAMEEAIVPSLYRQRSQDVPDPRP
ncbi:MAG: sulfotransferase family protein [Anaerolineaceae bacterium]|nr:sulfotransferase family protein [Anaerolineaceae bacterium]